MDLKLLKDFGILIRKTETDVKKFQSFIPKELSERQQKQYEEISKVLKKIYEKEPEAFWDNLDNEDINVFALSYLPIEAKEIS